MSSRMENGNKLLLSFRGRTVIEETVSNMLRSNVSETIVVTGHHHDAIEGVLKSCPTSSYKLVFNPDYAQGRAESIKCGLSEVSSSSGAALFMVADKPTVSHLLISRAIAQFEKVKPAILFVETPEGRGHPIIYSKKLFEQLNGLKGDVVGDNLIDNYKEETEVIQDDQIQIDIDSEKDYQRLSELD